MSSEKTNIFVSYSFNSSKKFKDRIVEKINKESYAINYSEKDDISDKSDEIIWEYLKKRIYGSSVMIIIYSEDMEKGNGGKALKIRDGYATKNVTDFQKQGWIYKEIRCGLRHQNNNHVNGMIVVMPDAIWKKKYGNGICNASKKSVLSFNYSSYPPILNENRANKKEVYKFTRCGCCNSILEDSFIPIVKESEFMDNMKKFIDIAKDKRGKENEYNIKKETD